MKTLALLSVCSALISAFVSGIEDAFDAQNYASNDVITRDVAVIGGGVSGTYGAINLQKLGKSVVMVERESVLGGHTNTYIDPTTGISVDYGVQAFWNVSVTRDYFAHFNIPITNATGAPLTTIYADFQTGQQVTVQSSNNYTAYQKQLQKYPYLEYSWNLPSPVPEDLLLPFADFVAKYDLQDIAYSVYFGGEGVSDILEQSTVNIMKFVDQSYLDAILDGAAVVPLNHNNGDLYTKALVELGPDALLSSTVVAARRPLENSSGVSLVVQTPSGQKLIKASKLLSSIPPLLDNMRPFDLDATEHDLFSQWNHSGYYTMIVNNTGLPSASRFENANATPGSFNIPKLPAPYQITQTSIPGLFYVWYGSPYNLPQATVKADVTAVVEKLRSMMNSTVRTPLEFVEFRSHTPFKLVVPAEAIAQGFYNRLESRE
ncbi:hypothetical protein MMC27_005644 [Xylographa pallens]|nr:hypothetical protein [Xylographa pallens]